VLQLEEPEQIEQIDLNKRNQTAGHRAGLHEEAEVKNRSKM
jgi:hypothetical protein